MKLGLRVYRETVWHFDGKERLGKVFVLRHRVRRLQFCPNQFRGSLSADLTHSNPVSVTFVTSCHA